MFSSWAILSALNIYCHKNISPKTWQWWQSGQHCILWREFWFPEFCPVAAIYESWKGLHCWSHHIPSPICPSCASSLSRSFPSSPVVYSCAGLTWSGAPPPWIWHTWGGSSLPTQAEDYKALYASTGTLQSVNMCSTNAALIGLGWKCL